MLREMMLMPKKDPTEAQGEEVGFCFGPIPKVSNHARGELEE
jgi:hypothetical protein